MDSLLTAQANSLELLLSRRVEFVELLQDKKNDPYAKLRSKYPPVNGVCSDSPTPQLSYRQQARQSTSSQQQQLFQASHIKNEWLKHVPIGPGIINAGNTCFLNSVVQCLIYTAPLSNYLTSGQHRSQCQKQGFCALCQMAAHCQRALQSQNRSPIQSTFVKFLRSICKTMRVGRQEDSNEFLRFLLEAMQQSSLAQYSAEQLPASIKQTNPIFHIFGGQLRSVVKCMSCGNESVTHDPFMDLSLDIKGCDTLELAMQKYTRVDKLFGSNKYKCDGCKRTTNAEKQISVQTLPNALTLQLKRFDYNAFGSVKLSKRVVYPETLDASYLVKCNTAQSSKYKLYAVLVHSGGSVNTGHYYSFVKSSFGVWYCMDDENVSQVKRDIALKQQAYMLFYVLANAPVQQLTKPFDQLIAKPQSLSKVSNIMSNKTGDSKDAKEILDDIFQLNVPIAQRLSKAADHYPSPKPSPKPSQLSVVAPTQPVLPDSQSNTLSNAIEAEIEKTIADQQISKDTAYELPKVVVMKNGWKISPIEVGWNEKMDVKKQKLEQVIQKESNNKPFDFSKYGSDRKRTSIQEQEDLDYDRGKMKKVRVKDKFQLFNRRTNPFSLYQKKKLKQKAE